MSRKTTERDLKRFDQIGNEEIDYDEIPELDAEWFENARVVIPPGKKQVTVRLDRDVLAWLKSQGRGYQTRINSILRAYYDAHTK